MKYCTKCGKQLDDNVRICTGCGCLASQDLVLTIHKEKQFFLVNPAIDVEVTGNGVAKRFAIKSGERVNINLPSGQYHIYAHHSVRKTNIDVNLTTNKTIVLTWNRFSGALESFEE